MKKSIISIFTIMLFLLVGCKKENKIWVYENDYSLINENLIVDLYTNLKENPYLKKENIVSIFLYNNENEDLLPINIISIKKDKFSKTSFKNRLELDLNLYNNDLFKVKEAYLIINYINEYTLKIKIGSLSTIKVEESYDLSIISLFGNINNNKLDSIKIKLSSSLEKDIRLFDIMVINAKVDNIYINDDIKNSKEIEILVDNVIRNTGIVIHYQVNAEDRYKVIYNFNFIEDYKLEENIYYV